MVAVQSTLSGVAPSSHNALSVVVMTTIVMVMITATTATTPATASLFFTGEKAGDIFPSQSDLPLTTCDQCTIYSGREWCPIDFSCHVNASSCGAHCRKQAKLHPSIAALYPQSAGTDDDANLEGDGGSFCVGIQFCFYGSNKCSDCVFGGGTWCPQKRRCYMFDKRPTDNNTLPSAYKSQRTLAAAAFIQNMKNEGEDEPVYSSLICQESCQDDEGNAGECIQQDNGCPDCEQFHPSLKCSALLPILVLSSFGSVGLAIAIAYAGYVLFKRMRAEYLKKQLEKQRLQTRKIARARAKAKKRQLQHDQIVQEQDNELAGCSCDEDDKEDNHQDENNNDNDELLSGDEEEEEEQRLSSQQARQATSAHVQGEEGEEGVRQGSIN